MFVGCREEGNINMFSFGMLVADLGNRGMTKA